MIMPSDGLKALLRSKNTRADLVERSLFGIKNVSIVKIKYLIDKNLDIHCL